MWLTNAGYTRHAVISCMPHWQFKREKLQIELESIYFCCCVLVRLQKKEKKNQQHLHKSNIEHCFYYSLTCATSMRRNPQLHRSAGHRCCCYDWKIAAEGRGLANTWTALKDAITLTSTQLAVLKLHWSILGKKWQLGVSQWPTFESKFPSFSVQLNYFTDLTHIPNTGKGISMWSYF